MQFINNHFVSAPSRVTAASKRLRDCRIHQPNRLQLLTSTAKRLGILVAYPENFVYNGVDGAVDPQGLDSGVLPTVLIGGMA